MLYLSLTVQYNTQRIFFCEAPLVPRTLDYSFTFVPGRYIVRCGSLQLRRGSIVTVCCVFVLMLFYIG